MLEAAAIDGSIQIQRTIRIMLPMISPIILFNLIMQIISAFKVFTNPISSAAETAVYWTAFFSIHCIFIMKASVK